MCAAPSGRIGSRQVGISPVGAVVTGDDVVCLGFCDWRNVRLQGTRNEGYGGDFQISRPFGLLSGLAFRRSAPYTT